MPHLRFKIRSNLVARLAPDRVYHFKLVPYDAQDCTRSMPAATISALMVDMISAQVRFPRGRGIAQASMIQLQS